MCTVCVFDDNKLDTFQLGTDDVRLHTLDFRSLGVGFTHPTNDSIVTALTALFGITGSGGVFTVRYSFSLSLSL